MAVKGLDVFTSRFAGESDQFVMIGGAACELWFSSQDLRFRPTKDLDLVLILENLSPDFVQGLWHFIQEGGYRLQERGDQSSTRLYRFSKPARPEYPDMLELLSQSPQDIFPAEGQVIVPIRLEDAPSLSAILLHPTYYNYLLQHRIVIEDLPIASASTLLLLKARAWLDLSQRKEAGEPILSDDIKKHRGDVFRIAATLTGTHSEPLPEDLHQDLLTFLTAFQSANPVWDDILKSIRRTLPRTSPEALLSAINDYYEIAPNSHLPTSRA